MSIPPRLLITPAVTAAVVLPTVLVPDAEAHGGRRFEVKVVDDQLVAQGYISTGVDDGGGVIRPYTNAIHGHWSNFASNTGASATLPGFDVLDEADALIGGSLTWTLQGVYKWTPTDSGHSGHGDTGHGHTVMDNVTLVHDTSNDASHDSGHTGIPHFLDPLDDGETIFVTRGITTVSSTNATEHHANLTLDLLDSFNGSNGDDIDLSYEYLSDPLGVPGGSIYVIAAVLKTDVDGIMHSDPVYTLLSPDGANHAERLHHEALELETLLGTPVPEPASIALIAAVGAIALRRRRVSRT